MPPRPSRNGTPEAPSRQPDKGGVDSEAPFWRVKTLEQMSRSEWERLCDGCGRCCLVKLEDEDTGDIHKTDIACKLLDAGTCRCSDYPGRQKKVDDCIKLTPKRVRSIPWLPSTCAYRLISEGKPLYPWHPLVSGSSETVHSAGISVRDKIRGSEKTVRLRDYVRHIVDWAD